jgi:hypothetical protein
MKESMFNNLVLQISSKLNTIRDLGFPISNELISQKIDEIAAYYKNYETFFITEEDFARLKFHVGNIYNIRVGEPAITLHNPDLPRWFDSKKSKLDWSHWIAYESMLQSKGRSKEIIKANEEVIDDILDYSGDPLTPGAWSRKGLVMGNVQSGKTENYIGLINKAIDCGYKTIILLGGHLNDLRMQTQERVDEGVLGRKSKHIINLQNIAPEPIGVGLFRENSINTGTTTIGDFNKNFADRLGFKLTGEDPVIFTVKKHTGVMGKLYSWIKDYHYLDPDGGKRLPGPLLLIDDEADYASINTKHHREEVTLTNEYIRELLSLFHRNTYVGYTATPFANIFIDPDENAYSDKADLFPSDFMIKMAVPDNYLGQDYYFGQKTGPNLEEYLIGEIQHSPTVAITDYFPIYELKSNHSITAIPESLKEAIRSFVLVIAIRSLRGEQHSHNTMLVNISHLKSHQNRLEFLINEYQQTIYNALVTFSEIGIEKARSNITLGNLEITFRKIFTIDEDYIDVFQRLTEASGKIKVWAINQSNSKSDGKKLNYSVHKENGLCAIVIGGHKLSRGLTLEGLSISYFARNSKAYDTLMQMCRWFGYRPRYSDLCRVFLPQDSIDWYSFISTVIRELYQELELMSWREKRPSEFGLKVREHPGAMIITAKNKMGSSELEVRSQDLWGQVQRRFRFKSDVDINLRNLEYTKKFIQKLTNESGYSNRIQTDEKSGATIFCDVSYGNLIDFIKNINLPEDDIGNSALIGHLNKMRDTGLKLPRVTLFNQAGRRKEDWEDDLEVDESVYINTNYQFSDEISLVLPKRRMQVSSDLYKISSAHLGNSDDEKLFLKEEERVEVKNRVNRKPVSFDYICSADRDYPGLIIYLFAVVVYPFNDEGVKSAKLGHGKAPTVGYTVSFPRSENLKHKTNKEIKAIVKDTKHSYQVNKIHSQLRQLSSYEDDSDDSDDE